MFLMVVNVVWWQKGRLLRILSIGKAWYSHVSHGSECSLVEEGTASPHSESHWSD